MKALIFIALLQTGLLLAIFAKIVLPQDASIDQQPRQTSDTTGFVAPDITSPATVDGPVRIDERQLRAVIRDELSAYMSAVAAGQAVPEVEEVYDPILEEERQARREEVEQRIEYYTSVGTISDADMQLLKSEIARLDPENRRAMLQKLVRALNTGALDGRL